jgi:hypothetical protein
MLVGGGNKPHSIRNYTMFILLVKYCIGRFMLNNLGGAVCCYYHNEMPDRNCMRLCRQKAKKPTPNALKTKEEAPTSRGGGTP